MGKCTFMPLRIKMMEAGINQNELAEIAGISSATMVSRMKGERPWTTWEQEKIGIALNIPREEYGTMFFDAPRAC